MDSEAGARDLLEHMLLDASVEPTYMPLSLLKSITNNFSSDRQIGVGGFAVVYKGLLRNGTVAVKKLTQTLDVHEMKFHQEVDSLMRVKHGNIIRFLGYCSDTQGKVWKLGEKNVMAEERQRFLCFEFLPEGSLDKYISDASQGFEWITRYQIIKGICEGLHYLHQHKIVHLDLKPANILLDRYKVPKIADFGLSKCFDEKQTQAMTSNVFGSEGYMAPEFYGGLITFKSDIYSLGIIIIEILTGQKGYPEIKNVLQSWTERFGTSQGDIRLEPVRICAEMGIECADFNPAKRPVAQRIIERLAEMERTYCFIRTDLFTSSVTNVNLKTMDRIRLIPSTTRHNRFPVLVRVTAPLRSTESSRAGLDLVAVLDISGSMRGYQLESMKQAMMFVINNLSPDDRLSVVSFNHQPLRRMELSVMSDVNREVTRQVVLGLVAKGGTDMGAAMEEAAEILRQRGPEERSNRVGRIIFLSGGQDNSILNHHMSSEFPAETFGLGADHDPEALRYIADRTMGVYSYVNQDLDKIKDAFAQSLGGLMSVTAMDVQVNLQTLDGVAISYIHSGSYLTSTSCDKRSATILVPDLYAGEQKNFIVYLTIPEGEQNQFLTVSGSYRNPKISKKDTIQLNNSELVVLWSKAGATNSSEKTAFPDVAAELIRLRLVKCVWIMAEDPTYDGLPRSWEEIKGSEDGRSAPESAVSVLNEDLAEMQHEGKPFMLSWLTSHGLQRATTKGSASKSSAFRIKAMEEMTKKVEAEAPKRLPAEIGQLDFSEVPWDETERFYLRKYPPYEIDWDALLGSN